VNIQVIRHLITKLRLTPAHPVALVLATDAPVMSVKPVCSVLKPIKTQ